MGGSHPHGHESPALVCAEGDPRHKYASYAFLATKIRFKNAKSQHREKVGADLHVVSRGMGMDSRIGKEFLYLGPGYGGSFFPRDPLTLIRIAQEHGASCHIVESVVEVNATRKARIVGKIGEALDGNEAGKTIAVLEVIFKPETDDMRDSPALAILPPLLDKGTKVIAHDPCGGKRSQTVVAGKYFLCGWCR
ncbi:hypothetical protein N9985_02135 [Gammaproteobacteria bacterium]|nr:hypothetical protein [Gammaproteobacteria bacterium]